MVVKSASLRQSAITAGGPGQSWAMPSGLGIPKGYLTFMGLGVSSGTLVDHGALSIGISDGSNHRAVSVMSEKSVGVRTDTYSLRTKNATNKYVGHLLNVTGGIAAALAHSSLSDGSVNLTWPTLPATAVVADVLAFAGDEFECYVTDVPNIAPSSSGSVTGCPFAPDAAIFIGPGAFDDSASPVAVSDAAIAMGFSRRLPTIQNVASGWGDLDSDLTADPSAMAYGVNMLLLQGATLHSWVAITAYNSDGITLLEGGGANTFPGCAVMLLKLGRRRASALMLTSPTTTGQVEHAMSPSLRGQCAIFAATRCDDDSTVHTDDKGSSWGVGAMTSYPTASTTPIEGCVSLLEKDGGSSGNFDARSVCGPEAVRLYSGAAAIELLADAVGFGATGPILNWTTVRTTGRKFAALVIEGNASFPPVLRRSSKVLRTR